MLTVLRKFFGLIALLWILGWVLAWMVAFADPREGAAGIIVMAFANVVGVPAVLFWFGLKLVDILGRRGEAPRYPATTGFAQHVPPATTQAKAQEKSGWRDRTRMFKGL
jgi:hypothetical protein